MGCNNSGALVAENFPKRPKNSRKRNWRQSQGAGSCTYFNAAKNPEHWNAPNWGRHLLNSEAVKDKEWQHLIIVRAWGAVMTRLGVECILPQETFAGRASTQDAPPAGTPATTTTSSKKIEESTFSTSCNACWLHCQKPPWSSHKQEPGQSRMSARAVYSKI